MIIKLYILKTIIHILLYIQIKKHFLSYILSFNKNKIQIIIYSFKKNQNFADCLKNFRNQFNYL